jgi:hypothetical protein
MLISELKPGGSGKDVMRFWKSSPLSCARHHSSIDALPTPSTLQTTQSSYIDCISTNKAQQSPKLPHSNTSNHGDRPVHVQAQPLHVSTRVSFAAPVGGKDLENALRGAPGLPITMLAACYWPQQLLPKPGGRSTILVPGWLREAYDYQDSYQGSETIRRVL